jgi:hypothetical protein
LAAYYLEMKESEGWEAARLQPLLAGLLELVPWLEQWHNEVDPVYGERMGAYYKGFVSEEARAHGFTLDDLRAWKPAAGPVRRGRRDYGNHEQGFRQAFDQFNHALNNANQSQQYVASNPQQAQNSLESSKTQIQEALVRRKLPHSSTPLAKRIDAYRQDVGDQAASFLLAVHVPPDQGHQFQPNDLNAWRGLVDGLVDRFQPAPSAAKGKKQAADQSFEQLRVKAEELVADKTEKYDALHRSYAQLADGVQAMPLLKDLITIPERVHQGDFVLKLSEGRGPRRADAARLRGHAAAGARRVRQRAGLHPAGGADGQQQGGLPARQLRLGQEPLHGGAEPAAGGQHAGACDAGAGRRGGPPRLDEGRKFLLVPYHMIGARDMERRAGPVRRPCAQAAPRGTGAGLLPGRGLFRDASALR